MNTIPPTETIYFSVKGQVVIPRRLRREFGIEKGTRAVVQATPEGDHLFELALHDQFAGPLLLPDNQPRRLLHLARPAMGAIVRRMKFGKAAIGFQTQVGHLIKFLAELDVRPLADKQQIFVDGPFGPEHPVMTFRGQFLRQEAREYFIAVSPKRMTGPKSYSCSSSRYRIAKGVAVFSFISSPLKFLMISSKNTGREKNLQA